MKFSHALVMSLKHQDTCMVGLYSKWKRPDLFLLVGQFSKKCNEITAFLSCMVPSPCVCSKTLQFSHENFDLIMLSHDNIFTDAMIIFC